MAAIQGVWQKPGARGEATGSWAPRREGGDSGSRAAWPASPEDKLWQWPDQGPMAFSSKVKMGASGQPQVRWHYKGKL